MLGSRHIADLIPHEGSMVLLGRIEHWSEDRIVCSTATHRSPTNPLRRDGALWAVCGVEYGAQAMAIHGGLLSGGVCQPGMLASLRSVALFVERLDHVEEDLTVEASVLLRDSHSFMYSFSVRAASTELVGGRAAVFLL